MIRQRVIIIAGWLTAAALAPSLAWADVEPLTLYQLDSFEQYIGCLAANGGKEGCPEANSRWEKDRAGTVDGADLSLAKREYWDDGELKYICYQKAVGDSFEKIENLADCNDDCIVFPHSLCDEEALVCMQDHTPAECEDSDGDGLRKWEEDALGTSDHEYNEQCSEESSSVCGFNMYCETNLPGVITDIDGVCIPRPDCPETGCTAFHLETVSVNNNELIIHVYYDYSPVEAEILDLYLDYNFDYLSLIYARLLKNEMACGDGSAGPCYLDDEKDLHVAQELEGRLRLTVLSADSEVPIPTGPIVELVFNRINTAQTSVGFTSQDHLQREAMAPKQGEDAEGNSMQDQLADDSLWGDDVQVPAADPNGPRLLLYYSFDNSHELLDYKDVKSGEELCEQMGDCALLDDADTMERAARDKIEARLGNLQTGSERVDGAIDAVIGPGVYLDGKTNHLKLPVTVDDPVMDLDGRYYYQKRGQSFSLSTWFYSEGEFEPDGEPQVIFSRNTNEERTKFGVAAELTGSDTFDLKWFQGRVDAGFDNPSAVSTVTIASGLPTLEWIHLGMVLTDTLENVDDNDNDQVDEAEEYDRVSFFIDGEKAVFSLDGVDVDAVPFKNNLGDAAEYIYGDAFHMQCPYPVDSGGLYIHEEGVEVGVLGGSGSPELLFFASAENNLFGIEQMDLNGFERFDVIRDGVSSAKDVDYSPLLDKIVYSSSKNGDYDIWIANGDGSNARQITKGFGDTSRKIFARRPKWAPDGSAIVFDSNVYSIPYDDNWFARSYNIYYIEYDAKNNQVRIPLQDGGTVTELDYDMLVTNQIVDDYRLSNTEFHSYGAVWERGKFTAGNETLRGRIWFNTTNTKFKQKKVVTLEIPQLINGDKTETPASLYDTECEGETVIDPGGDPEGVDPECTPVEPEYELLDAYRQQPVGKPEQSQMLYAKEWITYENVDGTTDSAYEIRNPLVEVNPVENIRTISVDVWYAPAQSNFPDPFCWDLDADASPDAVENKYPDSPDPLWNWLDCIPEEVPNLYLKYVGGGLYAQTDLDPEPDPYLTAPVNDPVSPGLGKEVDMSDNFTSCGDYVKVRVKSPINNLPIYRDGNGLKLATVKFTVNRCKGVSDLDGDGLPEIEPEAGCPVEYDDEGNPIDPMVSMVLQIRKTNQELRIMDFTMDDPQSGRFVLEENALEFVDSAEFSPDGNRVVLTGIQKSRPVVLVTPKPPLGYTGGEGLSFNRWDIAEDHWTIDLDEGSCVVGPVKVDKISTAPMNVEGMDWTRVQRYYPCNWVGGHKERDSKMFSNAFKGGLDELRLYSYPREDGAFASDFERGHEWLEKEGRDGKLERVDNECAADLHCPAYQVCNTGTGVCEIRPCDPDADPGTDGHCGGHGVCTLMPVPYQVGESDEDLGLTGENTMAWVCSVECATDQQCFREECLNGPCRFCSDDKACIECQEITEQITDDLSIDYIDGCPDRNSFACEEGSCVTECYEFENGESIYLCDPAIEYCNQGRCKLFDWDWTDIAPMSFQGLGETAYVLPKLRITTAIPQIYPVTVKAYGVEDYMRPPEILVEGKYGLAGKDPFKGEWFKIGQVQIYNKTKFEAEQNPYTLYTPVPVRQVRARLILPSYDNLTSSARGYNDWEGDHGCRDGECQTCANWTTEWGSNRCPTSRRCTAWYTGDTCTWRATGSRSQIGYRVGIPEHEQRKFCDEHQRSTSCRYHQPDMVDLYLWGGNAAVAIIELSVNGKTGSIESNRICQYYVENGRRVHTQAPDIDPNNPFQPLLADYRRPDEGVGVTLLPQWPVDYMSREVGGKITVQKTHRLIFGDPLMEQSNQKALLYNDFGSSGLIETACNPDSVGACTGYDDGSGIGDAWALLNCHVFGETESTQATVNYRICSGDVDCNVLYPTMQRVGAIEESPSGCVIERGMRREPCYEWMGNDVSMDFMSFMDGAKQPWHTLDFDYYRSFGYEYRSLAD